MSSATLPRQIADLPATSALISAAPVLGRLLLAGIFLLSGFSKVAAPTVTIGYIQSVGLPLAEVAYGLAVATEILGGLALVVGFQTRLVALALASFTIATALTFHNDLSDQNQFIHFFKNIAMAGGLLQVVAFGAGSFSLDNRHR
ncbi:DoxX family protein [Microvirga roseola]|uniref:DoxX family protein n=1 Tax=Microvirga roseola TaxID=2883126 RepID=UPI001E349935|nr:DoxX family protein [Microvirga roseola]